MKSLLIWICWFLPYPEPADAKTGSECCFPIGCLSPPSARSRGPTSPWCQEQTGFPLWLKLCLSQAGKMLFPVISVHMQSITICWWEQQHLPLSPAPMGCPSSFPASLEWRSFLWHWRGLFQIKPFTGFLRSLLASFQTWIRFLTSLLTAPLHSCDPQLVLAIDNSRPAASILGLGCGKWENFQKLPQNEIWSCTNNWVAALL